MFRTAKIISFFGALLLSLFLGAVVFAQNVQDQRLADIRLQLLDLYRQIETLKRELVPVVTIPQKTQELDLGTLRRIDDLENELRDAIAKIEELEFSIIKIAADGNNQLRDLEFQLAEIIGSDLSIISQGNPLGSEIDTTVADTPSSDDNVVADFSDLELEMFEQAIVSYQSRNISEAKERFENYLETYPVGKYLSEAHYYLGETLIFENAWREAGQSFYAAYSSDTKGPIAPKSLLRMGESLIELGSVAEACNMLKNVGLFFPSSGEAELANNRIDRLGCR